MYLTIPFSSWFAVFWQLGGTMGPRAFSAPEPDLPRRGGANHNAGRTDIGKEGGEEAS